MGGVKMENKFNANEIIKLLNLKLEHFEKMLQITASATLEPNASNIEDYVAMVDAREVVVYEIKEIDLSLASWSTPQPLDQAFEEKIAHIERNTKDVIEQILTLDKKNQTISQLMMEDIKKDFKDFNNKKSVNSYYQYDVSIDGASFFDKQK